MNAHEVREAINAGELDDGLELIRWALIDRQRLLSTVDYEERKHSAREEERDGTGR